MKEKLETLFEMLYNYKEFGVRRIDELDYFRDEKYKKRKLKKAFYRVADYYNVIGADIDSILFEMKFTLERMDDEEQEEERRRTGYYEKLEEKRKKKEKEEEERRRRELMEIDWDDTDEKEEEEEDWYTKHEEEEYQRYLESW